MSDAAADISAEPAAVVATLTDQGVAPPARPPRGRLAVNVVALTAVRLGEQAVALLTSAYVSRVFGPGLMGVIGWNQAVLNYAALATNPGMQTIATRDVARDKASGPDIFIGRTLLQLALGLPVAVAAVAVAWLTLGDRRQALFMTIQAVGMLLGVLNVGWLFAAHERMVLASVLGLAGAAAQVPLLVWLIHGHGDMPLYLSLIYPIQIVIFAILLAVAWRDGLIRGGRPRTSPRAAWALFVEAIPVTLSGAAVMLFYNCDSVILGLHFDHATVGLYQRAYGLLLLSGGVIGAVSAAFLPRLATVANDPDAARAISSRLLRLLTLAGGLFFAVAFCFGRQSVVLIYAADFAPAGPVFEWLSVDAIFIGINAALVAPLNVWGRQKLMLWITLTAAVVNLVANLILLPRYGMWAAVWTTIGAEIVVLILATIARRRIVPVPWVGPTLRILTPLVAAALGVKWAVHARVLPWPVLLVMAVALYAGIAAWLERAAVGSTMRLLRRRTLRA